MNDNKNHASDRMKGRKPSSPLRRILKYAAAGLVTLVLLLTVCVCLLGTRWAQDRICRKATTMLSEELHTRVAVGSVEMDVRRLCFSLCDVEVDDQQTRPMFRLGRLSVRVRLIPLLRQREVHVTHVRVANLRAQLFTPPAETKPNFQFLIDSLANKSPHEGQRRSITVNVDDVKAEQVRVEWNGRRLDLGKAYYDKSPRGTVKAGLSDLSFVWKGRNKRGPMDCVARLDKLTLREQDGSYHLTLDSLRYQTDNHQPRRNVTRPKRGYFDTGHMDVRAHVGLTIDHAAKDTFSLSVTDLRADDDASGIHVHDAHFRLEGNRSQMHLTDLSLYQGDTRIQAPRARIILPDGSGRPLRYEVAGIAGRVLLRDISRPFTPMLRHFSLPLELTARMEGECDAMHLRDVHLWTADRQFHVRATGHITHLRDRGQRLVHFDIDRLNTTGRRAGQLIGQLAIKKFMTRQLARLGHITYKGSMDIRHRQEHLRGHVATGAGPLSLDLTVNGQTRYLTGHVRTDSLMLGRVIEMPAIGRIACAADFRFDISKERTARMRRRVGGKLPMGEVSARVTRASFRKIRLSNLVARLESNGALAQGRVEIIGGRADLLCSFSFTNTDSIHKMKVRPGVRFHRMSEERKQEKAERRRLRRGERAGGQLQGTVADTAAGKALTRRERRAARRGRRNKQ